jgi:hypothetical protein
MYTKFIILLLLALIGACTPKSVTTGNGSSAMQVADNEDAQLVFGNTITDNDLKKHLTFLASDSLKGRDTGSEGQKIAAQYIADFYKSIGLTAIVKQKDSTVGYFQKFPLQKITMSNGMKRIVPFSGKTRSGADTIYTENVMGFMEGTDLKDEVLVITSHYDHVGTQNNQIHNGADDDGSGTVSVLEIAQAFAEAKKTGRGPRRSILFMNVTGEEKGLLGSAHYVLNPTVSLEQTIADLNIDMVGRTDPEHEGKGEYIYVIGSDKLSSELHAINEEANKKYTKIDLDYKYNDPNDPNRFYYRSDHYNFAKNKIPVVFYFNGTHADYHQPTDDIEKIEFGKMQTRARLVFHTAWELVNRDKRIIVDSNKP